jgi:hypothetical protein
MRLFARIGVALLSLPLAALPASAEIFKVQLNNGTVVETAYQPQEASWDPGIVLLLTEVGNWIGVRKDEIDTVVTEAPQRGYGVRINTTTVLLGAAPNDNEIPAEPGAQPQGDPVLQAIEGLIEAQQESRQPEADYSIQQGVSTEQTQGIPGYLISPYASVPPQ